MSVPDDGYSRNVPDNGYSRSESWALNIDIYVFISDHLVVSLSGNIRSGFGQVD